MMTLDSGSQKTGNSCTGWQKSTASPRKPAESARRGLPEIGAPPLTQAAEAHPRVGCHIETDLVCPIPWYEVGQFEKPGDAEAHRHQRYGVTLANKSMSDSLRRTGRDDVLTANTLLGDLLRRALR
jgi:hypothetical protein